MSISFLLMGIFKNSIDERTIIFFRQMVQIFARIVAVREEKHVKYDGKITKDLPPREFIEMALY